jgi:hypothetical protein
MSNEEAKEQAPKAALYAVPIFSDNYRVGVIYMSSLQEDEFDYATTQRPEPSPRMGNLRRMLELIAHELAGVGNR